jgi:hypothetical protein
MIAAGSLTAGSCTGALVGNFTVTGGLYPRVGWAVPNFGAEAATSQLPPAGATPRVEREPQFAGYYPAQVPVTSSADDMAQAERDFDRLYDDPPRYAEARYSQPAAIEDDWPDAPPPSADVYAYSEVVATD